MIHFDTITDINEAKTIWTELSPNAELYDDWQFRYLYWQFSKPEINFIVGYDGEYVVGVLPLQWNETENYYEFFGGSYMSYNSLFVKPDYEEKRSEFLTQLDKPAYLRWMRTPISHEKLVVSDNSTYILPLTGLTSMEDFFTQFVSKTRGKQIRKEARKLERKGATLVYDRLSDFDILVELNKKKFGDNSVFHNPYRGDFFKEVMKHFETYLVSLSMNNEIQGVALRVVYNNVLYGINTGVREGISNIGKYLYLKAIEMGIEKGFTKYDALEGAYGWKEDFGFVGRPQYHLDLR